MAAALLVVTVSEEEHGLSGPTSCGVCDSNEISCNIFTVYFFMCVFSSGFLFVNEGNPCPVPLVK